MADQHTKALSIHGARLSRRGFLVGSGALFVSLAALPGAQALAAGSSTAKQLDASAATAWIEIHADNSVVIRTGKCDFGQGSVFTAYPQIVADELGVSFSAITQVVAGDTDRTPDGGGTFGLLRTNVLNLRKVAAYTREAILAMAAESWSLPREQLSVKNGIVTAGDRSQSYGELIAGKTLDLTIPVSGELTSFRGLVVDGEPPLKSVKEYQVVGQSLPNPIITEKVAARATWVGNVKLPNMLHARVVLPPTLGSTLKAVGSIDAEQYPTAQVVRVGNLLAVVADSEWEAIQASRVLATTTQWSDWKGLPGSDQLFEYLRTKANWDVVPANAGQSNHGEVSASIDASERVLSVSCELPYQKHVPIGPSLTLADVQSDGAVTIHTHSQNPQFLRHQLALMLGVPTDKVVVRTYPGPGHYGRSNGGTAGSECQAVLLSRAVGRPVRLQWMRPDDLQWSTQSSAGYADIRIALDDQGKISAYQADHFGPPMQDDRLLGAMLAGLPTIKGPVPDNDSPVQGMGGRIADGWMYGQVPNVLETAHSTWQVGQQESPLDTGLRDHSMRTPVQFQQNFPREVAISEAASLAGVDALQFRIDNASDRRLIRILEILRRESNWESRPSPRPDASATGSQPLKGQGVSIMYRGNGYWACACQVTVVPESGEVTVDELITVVDTGVVVNPKQHERQVQAGSLMGVSQALFEEVTFDEGAVTIADWISYPILKMEDMPNVKVVLAPDPETDVYGQGSEGANAIAPSAIASAVFDATGKPIRRLPIKPDYVKAALTV